MNDMKKKMLEFVEPLIDNISIKQLLNLINERYSAANLNDCYLHIEEGDSYWDEKSTLHLIIEREETDEEFNKRTKKRNNSRILKLKKEFGTGYNYDGPIVVENLIAISNVREKSKNDPEFMKTILISAGILDKEGNLTQHYRGELDA